MNLWMFSMKVKGFIKQKYHVIKLLDATQFH